MHVNKNNFTFCEATGQSDQLGLVSNKKGEQVALDIALLYAKSLRNHDKLRIAWTQIYNVLKDCFSSVKKKYHLFLQEHKQL